MLPPSAADGSGIAGVSRIRPELYWTVDVQLRLCSIAGGNSELFERFARLPPGHALADALGAHESAYETILAHRRALAGETVSYQTTHRERHYRSCLRPMRDEAGRTVGVRGIAVDATVELSLSRSLERAQEILAVAQEAAHLGSWTREGAAGEISWSHELFKLCGVPVGSIVPTMDLFLRHVHPEDRLALEAALDVACEDRGIYALDARLLRVDGSQRWVHHRGAASLDASGAIRIVGTVLDIDARRGAEARLDRRAHYDDVTGLRNRTSLLERVEAQLVATQHTHGVLAVLFIAFGRYQNVCDTLGHTIGNALLRAIVPRLATAAGEGHTLARCGVDEFAIVLGELSSVDEAARAAERIVRAFAVPVTIEGLDIYANANVGIAVAPGDGDCAEALLDGAAAAYRSARDAGQTAFRFHTQTTHATAIERLDFEHRLRRAVETDAMEVHFQPIVDRFERPVAAEALVRWNDERFGSIPPGRFVPLCEELGLIVPLGRWIAREGIARLGRWDATGLPRLRLALNISGRQLRDPGLCAALATALERECIAPERIELEITESVIMDDVEMARSAIADFKALGVRVALDDFGTGYSSLSYLKHFRVDALKIDRAFVMDLPHDRGDAAIVSAVVALGHAMELSVVAEGVETAEQAALVRKLGCDELQGFYFSKPLSASEFEVVMRAWSGSSRIS